MNLKITQLASVVALFAFSFLAHGAEVEVGQENKTLVMNGKKVTELKINQGDVIRFTNLDPFFHNIFSTSPVKNFDLGSFPKGDSRSVTFDQKGAVAIECAIHPQMQLSVQVQ